MSLSKFIAIGKWSELSVETTFQERERARSGGTNATSGDEFEDGRVQMSGSLRQTKFLVSTS